MNGGCKANVWRMKNPNEDLPGASGDDEINLGEAVNCVLKPATILADSLRSGHIIFHCNRRFQQSLANSKSLRHTDFRPEPV